MVLALILARQGIEMTLLEAHADFDRDFRGDSVHALTLRLFDELGVIHRVLQIPHSKLRTFSFPGAYGPITPVDFGRLRTPYPYLAMVPQAKLLDCLADEAGRYPNFHLMMGATVQELITQEGSVRGVRYKGSGGTTHEVQALLTIGADGRFSRVRKLAGIEPLKTSPPIDVLWFRLPRRSNDPTDMMAFFGKGQMLVLFDRDTHWQMAFAITKGSFQQLRAIGIATLRQSIVALVPSLADRVYLLQDWKQCALLSVEASHVRRWYKPGLLLIGDAAHVMSPVGGVGINYAIQDAVAAANVLSAPLKRGHVTERDLAAVQRRRELPTRFIQTFQMLIQNKIIDQSILSGQRTTVPFLLRLLARIPLLNALPAYLLAFGLWPVRLSMAVRRAMRLPTTDN